MGHIRILALSLICASTLNGNACFIDCILKNADQKILTLTETLKIVYFRSNLFLLLQSLEMLRVFSEGADIIEIII